MMFAVVGEGLWGAAFWLLIDVNKLALPIPSIWKSVIREMFLGLRNGFSGGFIYCRVVMQTEDRGDVGQAGREWWTSTTNRG
jgi:hypothetical protein